MEPQMMNQEISGMTAPDQIQAQIDSLSDEEKQMAKQSLQEIRAISNSEWHKEFRVFRIVENNWEHVNLFQASCTHYHNKVVHIIL